jgi:hypothetical protein
VSSESNPARSTLDEIVCRGVAFDVFHAVRARYLFETLDAYLEIINESGLGKVFIANLQQILDRDLYLSLARLYEPHSPRNPGRSIPATAHFICLHAGELEIVDREPIFQFLSSYGKSCPALDMLQDEKLSLVLGQYIKEFMPKGDSNSERPLDQALAHLKTVRDKAIAHHDRVDPASLIVPAWPESVALIEFAQQFLVLIARAYLNVSHNLEYDASRAATSLRRLLKKAGLIPRSASTPEVTYAP